MRPTDFIAIDSIAKRFGDFTAVKDVSFGIGRGEFFSLLGPSGCGKTTLMRMIAGFETPSEGEIFLDGAPMVAIPPHLRPVNMVFQNYAIFPHLTVAQNIAFGLRKERLSKLELQRRVGESLDLIKLPGYGDRLPDQLSGGQRQRVALARALIKKPKVLLLDEPLGALDKKLREQMQLELRALQRSVGITFIFVTHDQDEALTMSDRIAVMSAGRVAEIGTPASLYATPRTRFVADFLGTMNFFAGRLVTADGETAGFDADGVGLLHLRKAEGARPGESMEAAVRPENIGVSFEQPASPINVVKGRIDATSFHGDRSFLYVRIEGRSDPVIVARQNAGQPIAPGAEVWLTIDENLAVLIPCASDTQ